MLRSGENKIIGSLVLVLIYFYALGVEIIQPVQPDYQVASQSEQEEAISLLSKKSLFVFNTDERVSGLYKVSFSGSKDFLKRILLYFRAYGIQLEESFVRYKDFSLNLLIGFKTISLLYPFHAFP